jgi:valyl-tRNA synthetase
MPGIATQMVVERQLNAGRTSARITPREAFIDKVWEWKAESGGTITNQLRRLGCSMDWSREQFTMDPHFTRPCQGVRRLCTIEGLIYRDKRLVNWDPQAPDRDLRPRSRDARGAGRHFGTSDIRWPMARSSRRTPRAGGTLSNIVATTRPETMLADMAVAVHPEDERYKSVIGKHVKLPITGRRIPIVADDHADPSWARAR